MSEIINFYNNNKGNAQIYKNADEYLIKDLLFKNLSGNNKIKTLDGMDMESKLNNIIPGMIYTFIYKSNKQNDDINFGDNFPMILCTNLKAVDNKLYIQGINLNMLSKHNKLFLLDFITEQYSNFYTNEVYNASKRNKIVINEDLANKLINSDFLITICEKLLNINIFECFRSYNMSICKNIRLIEYNLWKYIPFCSTKRIIENLSSEQMEKIQNQLLTS